MKNKPRVAARHFETRVSKKDLIKSDSDRELYFNTSTNNEHNDTIRDATSNDQVSTHECWFYDNLICPRLSGRLSAAFNKESFPARLGG